MCKRWEKTSSGEPLSLLQVRFYRLTLAGPAVGGPLRPVCAVKAPFRAWLCARGLRVGVAAYAVAANFLRCRCSWTPAN